MPGHAPTASVTGHDDYQPRYTGIIQRQEMIIDDPTTSRSNSNHRHR